MTNVPIKMECFKKKRQLEMVGFEQTQATIILK